MNEALPKRNTFILLLIFTCIFLIGFVWLIWIIPNRYISAILISLFGFMAFFGISGSLILLLTILKKRSFLSGKIRGIVIKLLFPVLLAIGKIIGIGVDGVRRSFVAVNNELVMAEAKKVPPEKLLILLPHCLQNHECKFRIIGNIKNCKRCGRCKIKDLIELAERYNVQISVATGGTLARKIVKETKPSAIVAVACERDLTSGIQDVYPLPVFGILNKRPNGPCYDTDVDLDLVKKGIEVFLGHESKGSESEGTKKAES